MEEIVVEIIGTIIIEGGKYLISKALDEVGNWIWRAFTDEDGDGVPDDPENPFREWDEEPDDWEPFDPVPVDPVIPVDPDDSKPTDPVGSNELQIIIVSPDGTMTIYDEGGNITAEVADNAYSLWLSENNALEKRFENYSVSEALLLFIAVGSLVGLICKIFKRRKL